MSFKYLLVLTFCFFSKDVFGQSEGAHLINHYTNDNGLSQNEITDIALDKNGFLWICTQGGLLRFDGSKFWHYNSTNSILNVERTSRVAIGKSGNVFVKSSKRGDIIYTVNDQYQLTKDTIFSKYKYVALFPQHDPIALDPILEKATKLYGPAFSETKTQIIDAVFNVSGDNHLYYTQNERNKFRLESINTMTGMVQTYALNLDAMQVRAILGNVLFFLDTNQQFSVISNGTIQTKPAVSKTFLELIDLIKRSKRNEVKCHRQGANNSLIIQINDVLWHVFSNAGVLDAKMIFRDIHINDVSTSVYDEKNRTLFVGTFTKGLYIIRSNPFNTILFSKTDPAKNITYAQIQVNDKFVVNRYFRYSPYDTSFIPFKEWREISAFYRTRDHKILYSNTSAIVVCDSNFNTTNVIPFPNTNAYHIVGCFLEDEQDKVWFASYNSLGYISNGKPVYKIYSSEYFLKNKISTLFNLDARTMWIGHENGIISYDKQAGRLDTVLFLPGHNVRTIYRARDNSIWIGTYGKGFYKYFKGRFIAMPLDVEKRLLFTHSFNEDENGFFWIPTNNGLLQCKKEALDVYAANKTANPVYYYYWSKTNKYTNEFNGGSNPASVRFNDLLLLPSLEGVVSFAPNAIRPELPNGSLIVESVVVDGKRLSNAAGLMLPPDFRQLELSISAPYMGDAINNVLEYKLEEIGNTWYPLINGRIIYNQLPNGNYHLSIRKRTGFGIHDYAYHLVTFMVKPFWYQTWVFYILSGLALIGIIYCSVRLRFRVMEHKQRLLEKVVDERTEALQETITELHESEEHLNAVNEIQEQAIAIILHDIQSPIKQLSRSANAFDKQIDTLSSDDIREYTKNLAESTSMINSFTGQLVNWLIFNRDNKKVVLEKVLLQPLLAEIKNLYSEIAQNQGTEIIIRPEIPEALVTDRNKLALIIRNLVDNATKNCKGGTISLAGMYSTDRRYICITVGDTGEGMSATDIERLRKPLSNLPYNLPKEKLGFNLVRQFVQSLNGHYEIESERGSGTTVRIFLPNKTGL